MYELSEMIEPTDGFRVNSASQNTNTSPAEASPEIIYEKRKVPSPQHSRTPHLQLSKHPFLSPGNKSIESIISDDSGVKMADHLLLSENKHGSYTCEWLKNSGITNTNTTTTTTTSSSSEQQRQQESSSSPLTLLKQASLAETTMNSSFQSNISSSSDAPGPLQNIPISGNVHITRRLAVTESPITCNDTNNRPPSSAAMNRYKLVKSLSVDPTRTSLIANTTCIKLKSLIYQI